MLAVINLQGFIKYIEITPEVLRSGRLRVALIPHVLATVACGEPPERPHLTLEFRLRRYDPENYIAYFDSPSWV